MLSCEPPEMDKPSEAERGGVMSSPEAEVEVLDLERPPMCKIGAEGRENTGVGGSIHIHQLK
jgi:hypothetical protein